jgi:hypothetical protein
MTDENVRPTTDPTREAEPEPAPVNETDAATAEAVSADDARVDENVELVEAEPEVHAPTGATVERVSEPADGADSDAGDAPVAVEETAEAKVVEPPVEHDAAETVVADADVVAETEAPPAGTGAETVSEPGVDAQIGDQRSDTFVWHPDHAGKTADEVRAGLAQEIASDQRQHRLALDGAEESEQDALASVVSLERKWGPYDFDWAEQDPEYLAARITEFEQERERRRQMLSWEEYRTGAGDHGVAHEAGERPAELSTGTKALSLLLVVLLIVIILLAVWAL